MLATVTEDKGRGGGGGGGGGRLLLLGAIDGISGPSTVNVAYDRPRVCKLKCPPSCGK